MASATSVAFTGETTSTSTATTPTTTESDTNIAIETMETAARPKLLLDINEATTTASSSSSTTETSVKPQLAQSPTAAATTSAQRYTAAIAAPTSPGGSSQSAISPSFLPEMPQWKKDLIQRRKTNVARTIGAAAGSGGGSGGSCTGLTPTSSCSSLASSASATSTPRTSFSAPALAAITTDHQYIAPDAWHTPTKETNSTLHTRTIETKVLKQKFAATTATKASQQDKDENPTHEQALNDEPIYAKMPATTTTTTTALLSSTPIALLSSPTKLTKTTATTLKSPITTPTKEKSDKFLSGGHYTPQATNNTRVLNEKMEGEQEESKEIIMISGASTSTLTSTTATAIAPANVPIPKQRSTVTTTTSTSSSSSSKSSSAATTPTKNIEQPKEYISSLTERKINIHNTPTAIATTTTSTTTRLTGYSMQREHSTESSCSGSNYKRIPSTTSSAPTTAQMQTNTLLSNQLHSKNDNERTIPSVNTFSQTSSVIQNTTNKISTKLQNNTFIKNQQNLSNTSPKYYKYKAHATQDNSALTTASVGGINQTTGSTSSINSNSHNNNINTNTNISNNTNKKKMVAVQEMKKTTATADSNINSNNKLTTQLKDTNSQQQQQQHQSNDLDGIEDLSYGPGIVSKLRCRYLSLALRESMEKERHNVDNMRRATSLSNLLERDDDKCDDDDDEDEASGDAVEIETQQQQTNTMWHDVELRGTEVGKMRATFLKQTTAGDYKTTATMYNKDAKTNGNTTNDTSMTSPIRTGGRMTQSQNVTVTGSAEQQITRSRQIKRGNDSIKRARSVEALLCEPSPWQFVGNRSSYGGVTSATRTPNSGTPTCVTIEDKIHNARERLLSGTDTMPPKRLTSIIDDTERPPPDLVKQTLRLFEATANRRRGGLQRPNSKGDVATKVANYKSIIKEQTPAMVFPKQPQSPTKKLQLPTFKPTSKPVVGAADLLNSPIGRKTLNAAYVGDTEMLTSTPTNASTPKQQQRNSNSNIAGFLSADTPDIIPRHNVVRHLTEKSEQNSGTAVTANLPVTVLTKKLEKLSITTSATKELSTIIQSKQQEQQTVKHNSTTTAGIHNEREPTKFVGGDATAEVKADRAGAPAIFAATTVAASSSIAADTTTLEPHQAFNDSMQQPSCSSSDLSDDEYGTASITKTKRINRTALDNIAKAGTTQQFKFTPTTTNNTATNAHKLNLSNGGQQSDGATLNNNEITSTLLNASAGKQIGVIRPLISNTNQLQQQPLDLKQQPGNYIPPAAPTQITTAASSITTLTTREIEKNRINEMKKTNAFVVGGSNSLQTLSGSDSNNSLSSTSSLTATSSLDTVINTNASSTSSSAAAAASGYSELDAAAAQITVGSTNSPLWALRKKRQIPAAAAENTSMVFNFSNRKEVPDYIENDGVIIRRKRELPKPNESGFVLLGDLSLETSTDNDYDEYSMCPPSPCDVEFENANVVIDGKSSIRQKPKEAAFRVQFNDTLTSTFEYPSEASLIVENSFNDYYMNPADDFDSAFTKLMIDDGTQSPKQHHHVAVDEIIQLPTTIATATATAAHDSSTVNTTTNTPNKNTLGNLPLGSAPLGLYTPIKAPIDSLFQLGVTRAPTSNGHAYATNGIEATTNGIGTHNGNNTEGCGSIIGIKDGLNDDYNNDGEPESLQYLKPSNDDLNMVYSEGTQKTDLLY